jgi:phage shock protein E
MKFLITLIFLALPVISQTHASELPQNTENKLAPVIIDVRTIAEWEQGHHPQAEHIEWQDILEGVKALGVQKNTSIILYCRSGNRAGKAMRLLQAEGYTNVHNGMNLEKITKYLQ